MRAPGALLLHGQRAAMLFSSTGVLEGGSFLGPEHAVAALACTGMRFTRFQDPVECGVAGEAVDVVRALRCPLCVLGILSTS